MGLLSKRGEKRLIAAEDQQNNLTQNITDGALDTLSNAIRIMGEESFPLESELDAELFPGVCTDFARHVENGSAVPAFLVEQEDSGKRQWSVVQRFLVDRRRREKKFVTERLGGYREIVTDLISGLEEIGSRDKSTEASIRDHLESMQRAISGEQLPQLRALLAETITKVNDTFAEQKRAYETQLKDVNDRMSSLRQDLVSTREEMKRDSLTQAYNRGAFDTAITQNLNLHLFSQQPVTLLMIDLDDFKKVNDSHGHSIGDAVLQAVGECLARSFFRKNDLVARYGGDEFAVILADTAGKDVINLAERFLNTIRDMTIESEEGNFGVSCSIGFTEAHSTDSVESFVNRADKALFQAKARGRDQSAYIPSPDG